MNRMLKAQMVLEERRMALGELLDMPEEKRAEDFTDKLETAKRSVQAASAEVLAAAELEPEVEEHRAETPEGAELRNMLSRSDLGNIFAAAFEKRGVDGVERELQNYYGISQHSIPLAMLERRTTPAPGDVGVAQAAIVQPVFHEGDAAYLAVSMPTVAAGDAVYPVLTTRPTVGGPHTDSTVVASTTGAFTADLLAPSRLQASFFYKRTDAARFSGMGESLRQSLSSGLGEALDKEVVDQIVTDVTRTDATAVDDYGSYRKRLVYDLIDGRFASAEDQIRLLLGTGTLSHMSENYRSTGMDNSAVDTLRRITGGLRVSPHVAAVVSDKQDVLVRLGSRMDAVSPVWQGIQLVLDEVTKAGSGEIVITAIMLAAFKVTRTDGFARIQTQHVT